MRADVNLSVREAGSDKLGTRNRDEKPELLQGHCKSNRGRTGTPDRAPGGRKTGGSGDPALG